MPLGYDPYNQLTRDHNAMFNEMIRQAQGLATKIDPRPPPDPTRAAMHEAIDRATRFKELCERLDALHTRAYQLTADILELTDDAHDVMKEFC